MDFFSKKTKKRKKTGEGTYERNLRNWEGILQKMNEFMEETEKESGRNGEGTGHRKL